MGCFYFERNFEMWKGISFKIIWLCIYPICSFYSKMKFDPSRKWASLFKRVGKRKNLFLSVLKCSVGNAFQRPALMFLSQSSLSHTNALAASCLSLSIPEVVALDGWVKWFLLRQSWQLLWESSIGKKIYCIGEQYFSWDFWRRKKINCFQGTFSFSSFPWHKTSCFVCLAVTQWVTLLIQSD